MKSKLKQQAINTFLKFLGREEVQKKIRAQIKHTSSVLPTITNSDSPYDNNDHTDINQTCMRDDIVFITSRFRSGSTLLWNLFRQMPNCTSYYEPFNERQWFDPQLRGSTVDQSHRGVADYSAEYNGLESLTSLYSEDWIRDRLLMTEESWDSNMKAYIEKLIDNAQGQPVLQFNRIDFRLPWLRKNFPNAKIVHLFRHPRDQWCSFLTDMKIMNKDDVQSTYQDAFYLDSWCQDLSQHYPFLCKEITPHPYQRFYYLWKLSYLFGLQYAHHSLSFEALTQEPDSQLKQLFKAINIVSEETSSLTSIIQPPASDRWKKYANNQWFEEHEKACEKNISLFLANN